ncbi:MAG TPA: MoaD/ThiS family protein [Pirellulaceae bacterium]|nr:MoaD/ThiS family protein [Pirellulaceae bacterium]
MKLRVRLFAVAKELAGSDAIELDIAESATVSDLRAALVEQLPGLASAVRLSMVAVNTEYAPNSLTLSSSDDIALIPPVSGG